jgi:GNAT superfamily N-acetyltransferase
MATLSIKTATPAEADQCIAVIVLAFSSDPGVRWMYPDPQQYLNNFPHFVRAYGGRAFQQNTAQYVDRFFAAALWLPPEVSPDEEALAELIENSVSENHREAVYALFEEIGGYHPQEPHWHLPLIGTDPTKYGEGYGSALLQHALAVCDQQQKLAYLEATSPRNVPLYRRHGFEVLGTIQVGTSPPITPMLRKPR